MRVLESYSVALLEILVWCNYFIHFKRKKEITINPQIRIAGLILFLKLQMWVLLEFGSFYLLILNLTAGLIRGRVLFEDLRR